MPTFSVLIAIHNAAPWLEACYDSLAAQTFGDFQVLCVDDASTDESPAITARRCAADARFEALATPTHSGQAVARNIGLAAARGTYTLFLDADDTLEAQALQRLADAFGADDSIDAAVFHLVKTWDDGRSETVDIRTGRRFLSGREACLMSIDWRLHGVYALRTTLHRQWPYDTTLRSYGDDNTTCHHYLACRRVALTDAVYYYRQHADSCTHIDGVARLELLAANALRRRLLEEAAIGSEGLRRCEAYCWYNFVGLYRQWHTLPHSAAEQREARRRFADALRQMRPCRLPRDIWRHPSTIFLRPYALFRAWQGLLMRMKKTEGRS